MGFCNDFINNANPFLISAIVFGILLYFQHKKCKKSNSASPMSSYNIINIVKSSNILLILFTTSLLCFILLEIFYHEQCPIDPVRYNQTLQIFTMNVLALKQMQIDHICYFGTLLYVLRQTSFAVWDQDSDIAIVKPNDVNQFVADLNNALSNISMGHEVVYLEERDLIQVSNGKAHGDIWFYTLKNVSNTDSTNTKHQILTNYDYTIIHPIVDYDILFPSHTIKWMGFDVPVPNKEKVAAEFEFGDDYMIPKYNRIYQCLENIVTNKVSPTRLIMYIVVLIFGNLLAVLIQNVGSTKHCYGNIRRNSIVMIIQCVPTKLIDVSMKAYHNLSSSKDISLPKPMDDEEEKLLLAVG